MRTRIAAHGPNDAVAVPSPAATAACLATLAGGLLFGANGVAAAVVVCLPDNPTQDASRSRDLLGRRDSVGFDQGPCWSRRAPRAVRWSRQAAALPCLDASALSVKDSTHPIRPCPPPSGSMANPCHMPVHLPGHSRMLLASRKRHPDLGIPHWMPGPTQDFRLPSGLPVCQSRLRPCRTRAAQRWLHNSIWHHDSTSATFLSPCAAAALQRRLARCHYLLPCHAHPFPTGCRDLPRQARR